MEIAGGKTYRTDTAMFFPQDVATETTVVDGQGQRLALNIENIRGGGGQRRISVFAPYWIVNTTEHPLRYKQEKSNSFVAGTVTSPDRDGSKPLKSSFSPVVVSENDQLYSRLNREQKQTSTSGDRPDNNHSRSDGTRIYQSTIGTIFSGTAGALASTPGYCELGHKEVADLIQTDLPINRLSQLAFMFNFSEGMLSLGHQKICVQLWDGSGLTRYASDWSQGLSLDSVGFSQVVRLVLTKL